MAEATPADRLRALMAAAADRPVLAPGVWDGLSARLAVAAGAGALLGDRRLNATFYDVAAPYATAARPAYDARAGLISWRLGFTASYRLSPDWRVFGFGRMDLVSGAANADSPLVSRQAGFTGGIGVQWTWMQSSQPAAD
jgi:outer membrane scaffolding protein for murein synthesis (MipA/OmpV family)